MVARRDTVIVTGSSGFVGQALLSTLAAASFEVIGFDRSPPKQLPSNASFDEIDHLRRERGSGLSELGKTKQCAKSSSDFWQQDLLASASGIGDRWPLTKFRRAARRVQRRRLLVGHRLQVAAGLRPLRLLVQPRNLAVPCLALPRRPSNSSKVRRRES